MKTVAIIGAGPGIGLAVAKKFVSEGYSVAALSRKGDTTGDDIYGFAADASDTASLEQALTQVKEKLSPPEVLGNGSRLTDDKMGA
jgi:NAD(P)-dependent dehydrogenase (short-subunit alcohol dehydrogenase family)